MGENRRKVWRRVYSQIKRFLDLLIALVTAPVWLLLGGVVSILVMADLGKPIFFRQQRAGKGGKAFWIYKFRTMRKGEGSDEERLTRMGRILRKTSMDEIPQMLNILRGDMSLVGPRPLLLEYLAVYTKEQARRHEVRPGITGWAQVNGRNEITWEKKFKLDVWYVDNQTIWVDFVILVKTMLCVFARKGITPVGKESVEKFTGTQFGVTQVRKDESGR